MAIPKNPFHPGDDFVTRRIGRFVEVNDARANVRLDVSAHGSAPSLYGSKVTSSHENYNSDRISIVSKNSTS